MAYLNKLTGSYPVSIKQTKEAWVDRRMDSDGVTDPRKRYKYEAQLPSPFVPDSDYAWVFPIPSGVDEKRETAKESTPKLVGTMYQQAWSYTPLNRGQIDANYKTHVEGLVAEIKPTATDGDGEVLTFSSTEEGRDFLKESVLALDSDNATIEVVLDDTTTKVVKKTVLKAALTSMATQAAQVRVDNRYYDPSKNGFLCVEDSTLENVATRSTVSVSTKGTGSVTWSDSFQRVDLDSDYLITSDVQSLMDGDFTLCVDFKGNTDHFTLLQLVSDSGLTPTYSQPLVNIIDGQVYAGISGTTAHIVSDSNAVSSDQSNEIGLIYNHAGAKLTLTVNGEIVGDHYGDSLGLTGTTLLTIGGSSNNYTENFGYTTYNNDLQGSVKKVKAWDRTLSPSDLKGYGQSAGGTGGSY